MFELEHKPNFHLFKCPQAEKSVVQRVYVFHTYKTNIFKTFWALHVKIIVSTRTLCYKNNQSIKISSQMLWWKYSRKVDSVYLVYYLFSVHGWQRVILLPILNKL